MRTYSNTPIKELFTELKGTVVKTNFHEGIVCGYSEEIDALIIECKYGWRIVPSHCYILESFRGQLYVFIKEIEIEMKTKSNIEANHSILLSKLELVDLAQLYVLVQWPEVQLLMEEDWFAEEAKLNIDSSSAYFIPLTRIE